MNAEATGSNPVEAPKNFFRAISQVAQAPKGAVNMTLRNSVIFIRFCMGIERSYKIVQNRGKRSDKIDLPSHLLSITCVSMAFGGVSKRFQWVFGSLFSSLCYTQKMGG